MRTVNPQRVENRRRQILDAARYCFEQKGFHATSMAEICARAELSPGGLYRYFASKEEIIVAMSEETSFNAINSVRERITDLKNGRDFYDAINAILDEIAEIHFNRDQGALCAESISEAIRNPLFAEAAARAYNEFKALFAQMLELGKQSGAVDKNQDVEELTAVLMACVDGLVLRMAFDNEFAKETAVKWLSNLFSRYLRPSENNGIEAQMNDVLVFKNSRKSGGQFDE